MKGTINTTGTMGSGVRAMSEREIDSGFEKVAGDLAGMERVEVTVPATGRPGEEVVELGYNGRMFLIRRGEPVKLPRPLIEVLESAGLLP